MSETMTVDIENIDSSEGFGYTIVTFPNRTKVLSATFTVNPEAYGSEEDDRNWMLYALVGHPYEENDDNYEFIWPIFFQSAKPVITRADNLNFRSNTSMTGILSEPDDAPPLMREAHYGVMESGDYLVMWLQADSGNFDTIDWTKTRATITLEYEDTTKGTVYELRDWANVW